MPIFKKTFLIIFVLLFTLWGSLSFIDSILNKDNREVIQFASWGSKSEVEIIKPILNEFERQYPEYKVDFLHIPENYFQKIHLLFASNLAPDVLFMNNLNLPFFANAGVLEVFVGNVNNYFERKSLDALSYKGKLYGIPRDISTIVVYVNKDLFKKYDVKLPNRHWDFEDLLEISKKLTKDTDGDGKTDIWGISFEEKPPLYYLAYLMSEGGGILSDDLSEIIFDSEESQKGLNFYSDLRNKYHVAPTKAESASVLMSQLFLQEKLAMQVSGRWLVPKYIKDANFDWNVINFPAGDLGSVVPLDASGWCISKSSKHKDGAKKLVVFLSNHANIVKMSESGLIVPARKDVLKNEFLYFQNTNPNCTSKLNNTVFINTIQNSKTTPVSVDYSEIQDQITQKTNYIFNK